MGALTAGVAAGGWQHALLPPLSACAQVLVSQQEDTIQYCSRLFNVTVEHRF